MNTNFSKDMHVAQIETPFTLGNRALRAGDYDAAINYYLISQQATPAIDKIITGNLAIARQKYEAARKINEYRSIILSNANLPEVSTADATIQSQLVTRAVNYNLISFDIWDTVLRRNCHPDEIKLRTARALWLLGAPYADRPSEYTPSNLYRMRKDAERDVADEHYEYQIRDVFNLWLILYGIKDENKAGIFHKSLLEAELRAECCSTRLDQTLMFAILSLKEKRKVAVSDFYHGKVGLSSILRHHGLDQYFEAFYVSCDWMKTKRAGTLFDVVLTEEKIEADEVFHIGDNPHADHAKAAEKGIKSYLYESQTEKDRQEWYKRGFEDYLAGNLETHWHRILNISGLAESVDQLGDISAIGHLTSAGKLLAPIVVGFVLHCMEEAVRRKCKHIYFFSREGIFFKQVYDLLVDLDVYDLGEYPDSRIIYVSRRATFAATLRKLELDELMRMWNQYSTQSVQAFARSLNFDQEIVGAIAKFYGINPQAPIQYPWQDDKFKQFFNSEQFQTYACEHVARQRRQLLQHLHNVDFQPDKAINRVIVDIGWRGTIQDNICYLTSGVTHGVYVALKGFLNQQPENSSKAGYLSDDNTGNKFDLGDVAALEFVLNAAGGSVIGYEDNGDPIHEIFEGEECVILNQIEKVQSGILAGTMAIGEYIRQHGLVANDLLGLARPLVKNYIANPPACIADAFLDLEHNETFGTGDSDIMAERFNENNITSLSGADLHSAIMALENSVRWPASYFNSTNFSQIFSQFRPDQILATPNVLKKHDVFSIIRKETRGDIISIVTPPPLAGSGGHRTIYNFAKGLSRAGFRVHLFMERCNSDLWYTEQELAGYDITLHKEWFAGIRPVVAVATIAHSARYVREFFPNTIGAYFVQDYEAEFNPLSDGYVRGQNSYAQGLAPICIGHWLPHVLRTQFGIGAAYGGLGVDTNIYYPIESIEKKDMVAFLYQPEKWRRMPETCIAALAIVKQKRPETKIVLYGSNAQPNLPFDAIQLGLVHDLAKLNQLYNEASVGLCLSLTNPSRIPIEYMAAGCVPVDLYRYNNFFDNPTGTSKLAYQSEASIAEAILQLLQNKNDCMARRENGIAVAKKRTLQWEVDTSVNAIKWLIAGNSINDVETTKPVYEDPPVFSDNDKNATTRAFCDWQLRLAKA